jgi:hypothetical protein
MAPSMECFIFDFRVPYQWDEINERIKKQFNCSVPVRVYQSVSSALLETVMGIQLLYSHKKQFHHSIGTGTHAEEAFLFLAKQGIKSIDVSGTEVVEIDDKKSLCILSDVDDALTAQIYTQRSVPEKLFNIKISHHLQHHRPTPLEPNESEILIYAGENMAIVCLGKRAQSLHPFFSPGLSWSGISEFDGFLPKNENEIWVKKVEKEKWAGGEPLLSPTQERIFDRAILYWPGLDAGALRDLMIKGHETPPESIETLSLNRWHETRLVGQFEKRGHSAEILRGTLFLSSNLSDDSQFRKKLEHAREHLKKISNF